MQAQLLNAAQLQAIRDAQSEAQVLVGQARRAQSHVRRIGDEATRRLVLDSLAGVEKVAAMVNVLATALVSSS